MYDRSFLKLVNKSMRFSGRDYGCSSGKDIDSLSLQFELDMPRNYMKNFKLIFMSMQRGAGTWGYNFLENRYFPICHFP